MKALKYILVLIIVVVFAILGYYKGINITDHKIKEDRRRIEEKIENLFNNKEVIGDGKFFVLSGIEHEMGYNFDDGGFKIFELAKDNNGYVKKTIIPNLAGLEFMIPEKEWISVPSGFKGGYWATNNRPSVEECYKVAYEYLLFGDKNYPIDIYKPDSYERLENFPEGFESEFYTIQKEDYPTANFKEVESNTIGNIIYSLNYNVHRSYFEIKMKNHIDISEMKNQLSIFWASVYGGIALLIGILGIFSIKILINKSQPKTKVEKLIINTKWRNIESGVILTITSTGKKKHSVILVENDSPIKGTALFEDDGKTIHLSFENKELFFQIQLFEKDKLELLDLSKNIILKFEKLGSNSYSL